MKRARFVVDGVVREGVWQEGWLLDEAGRAHDPERVLWLPPVRPSKVVGLALGFREHAEELGVAQPEAPALFFKPPSALVGHRAAVRYPAEASYVHYEVELAVVIGRRCRHVKARDAYGVVRGYTIANDMTARDYIANFYRPPVRAKGWDTSCPIGPWVVEGEIADPHQLQLRTYVNGELRQQGHTSQLRYSVPELIEFITSFMTLEPDDVILTGTPRGIAPLKPGDVMRLEIEGIGTLENPVFPEEAPR